MDIDFGFHPRPGFVEIERALVRVDLHMSEERGNDPEPRKERPVITPRRRWITLSRRLAQRAQLEALRRQHDREMQDATIAAEHAASSNRALARGERGCAFCR
jgi:hypothetical protein